MNQHENGISVPLSYSSIQNRRMTFSKLLNEDSVAGKAKYLQLVIDYK
jgi:hypothetical protein